VNRRSILFAALGLTLGAGAALAAGHVYAEHDDDHHDRRSGRHDDHHEHDDDEREDDDEGGMRGPVAVDPNVPLAPTPDNSLFLNGARPKVSVQ